MYHGNRIVVIIDMLSDHSIKNLIKRPYDNIDGLRDYSREIDEIVSTLARKHRIKPLQAQPERRRFLARQAKRLLPWWSQILGKRFSQRFYDLFRLKEL